MKPVAIDLTAPERLFALRIQEGLSRGLARLEQAQQGVEAAQARLDGAVKTCKMLDDERKAFEAAVVEDRGKPDLPPGPAAIEALDEEAKRLRLVWGRPPIDPRGFVQGDPATPPQSPAKGAEGDKASEGIPNCTCSHNETGERVPQPHHGPCPVHPKCEHTERTPQRRGEHAGGESTWLDGTLCKACGLDWREDPKPGEPGGPMLGDAAALELVQARLEWEAKAQRLAEEQLAKRALPGGTARLLGPLSASERKHAREVGLTEAQVAALGDHMEGLKTRAAEPEPEPDPGPMTVEQALAGSAAGLTGPLSPPAELAKHCPHAVWVGGKGVGDPAVCAACGMEEDTSPLPTAEEVLGHVGPAERLPSERE